MTKSKSGWIDPGEHLPWLIPAEDDRDLPPNRKQISIFEALAQSPQPK